MNSSDPKQNGDTPPRLSDSENGQAGPATPNADSLLTELTKVKNDFLYLAAEFENYKKQAIKERSDMRKYGAERLIVDLLSVLDIFDTALTSELNSQNLESFKKGLELTAAELRATLQRHGVVEMHSEGTFDPNVHEALSSEETDQVPPGNIVRVFKKPFKLHDRVIRPGQVSVAKPKQS